MKIEFYLPTKEEWYGTFDGGYVQVLVSNEKQPTNITKDRCDWVHFIFIIFQGNDDCMWAKRYECKDDPGKELLNALELISKIPLPVEKAYLKSIGFEVE